MDVVPQNLFIYFLYYRARHVTKLLEPKKKARRKSQGKKTIPSLGPTHWFPKTSAFASAKLAVPSSSGRKVERQLLPIRNWDRFSLCCCGHFCPNSGLLRVFNAFLRCPPWCWMVCPPFRESCLPLSPLVPLLVALCWMVCPPSRDLVSPCLPSCFLLLDGASAFPRPCLPCLPACLSLSPSLSSSLSLF